MAQPFYGEIRLMACTFAPKGWALCNGQVLPINQNQALFSILGTTYGGNGITTFALPDLRGKVAMHFGQGPGLADYQLGQMSGAESVTLNASQLPLHIHPVACNTSLAGQANPTGNFPGLPNSTSAGVYEATANSTMAAGVIANAGGSQPHENRQPLLTLNYIISLGGIFPART
jgi:microcystin-dependent protein